MYEERVHRIPPIAVVAATYDTYKKFIEQSGIVKKDRQNFRWVCSEMQMNGQIFSHVIRLEDYKEVPDYKNKIHRLVSLAAHGLTNKKY